MFGLRLSDQVLEGFVERLLVEVLEVDDPVVPDRSPGIHNVRLSASA